MGSNAALGLFTARPMSGEGFATFAAPAPNYGIGDAQFFTEDRPGLIQIRPLLNTDRTPTAVDTYPRGAMLLTWKSPNGKQLRAMVKLPFNRRSNIASNVELAIQRVERFSVAYGKLFRMAQAGIDPFDVLGAY